MAGIGFELRRVQRRGGLTGYVTGGLHGAIVAAGPWLFAIASIAIISRFGGHYLDAEILADFRVATVYAFSISLVVAGPIAAFAVRLAADALYTREFHRISELFAAASCAVAVIVPFVSGAVLFVLSDASGYVVATAGCTTMASLVWIAMALSGALKDYRGITNAFLTGFIFATLSCCVLAIWQVEARVLVHAFAGGLALIFVSLSANILQAFPPTRRVEIAHALSDLARKNRYLALGALFAAAALWVDKWLFWAATGVPAHSGLTHSPLYDSAMFAGCLAIIPALVGFVINLETTLFRHSRSYLSAILKHKTLREIEQRRSRLEERAVAVLNRIMLIQFVVVGLVVILAPFLVQWAELDYGQIAIFRRSVLGVAFQFLFFASSAVVLFFDRQKLFFSLQLGYLAANAIFTIGFLAMGRDFDGMGYVTASVICGLVAYTAALRTLTTLNFTVFMANNRGL